MTNDYIRFGLSGNDPQINQMETKMAKVNGDAAKKDVKKRNDGPVTISYLDGENKAAKRVPNVVSAIVVASKDGSQTKNYSPENIPAPVRLQMIAAMLGKKFDTGIRNSVKKGGNVLEAADGIFQALVDGKFYSRKEGTGGGAPGRPFNADIWVTAMENTAIAKKTPASEKQLADFRNKLIALKGKDRRDLLNKLQKDKIFALAVMKLEAEALKSAPKTEYDALSDAF